jgi:CheY-like chemotaxis protein
MILLIEDNATLQSLLVSLLRLEGYEVETCPLGNEQSIIESIRQFNPSVILMDVHLPQADGLNITRQLRADRGNGNIRIILSSGMSLEEECFEAGSDRFLMKPYMPDELMEMLEELS